MPCLEKNSNKRINNDLLVPLQFPHRNIHVPLEYNINPDNNISSSSSSTDSDDGYLQGSIEALDDEVDLISNRKRFDCDICMERIRKRAGVTLRDCLHEFCK